MEHLLLVLMIGAGAYLLLQLFLQYRATVRRAAGIRLAESAYQAALHDTTGAQQRLLHVITGLYGEEVAQQVSERDMWIGMPTDLLRASWGEAEDIENYYVRGAWSQKWYYGAHTSKLNTVKYKYEVLIEDDVVAGWKDLV